MATAVQALRTRRLPPVDNLKSAMVGWVIAGHALLGYSAIGGWPYDEVNEVTFGRRSELALAVLVGPSALCIMGTFFFLAGLFAPPALARHGPARFALNRAVRLGVPFLCFALLIWPLFMWFAYRAAGHDVSYGWTFTHRQPFLDSGPLWFAEVLLIFSVAYALWAGRPARRTRSPRDPAAVGMRQLVAWAAGIAVASFAVRLVAPARSTQVLDLHLWQWPQCAAMFALGVAVAPHGWAVRVPEPVYRGCGRTVAAILAIVPVLAVAFGISDLAADATPFLGGWHWQAAILAGVEASLVVAGSMWALGFAQRRLVRGAAFSAACGRGAYAAFVIQGPVLLALAIAARPFELPAESKALLVGALAVPACFGLGRLLADRTPLRGVL
ncbi:MAG TPA: acyltransferase [Micromonosporaceae bacterium]|nr:acyltransferase [Micromonosporaceae bacterium]